MQAEELRRQLRAYPRLPYGHTPTPLEPLKTLSRSLSGPQLWIKRDDGIGPAMGGNKGRKLEFLMAEIVQQGRRKVVTYGGLQSNHARMTAAACARLNLEAHLFFFARRPPQLQGNLLLDHLCGARLHFIPFGGGGDGSLTLETTNRLVKLVSLLFVGPGAYFMPVGGHNVTGCLGYVDAALEVHEQVQGLDLPPEETTVVTAAGTGGTLAGLLAGLTVLESPLRVLGIDVGKLWKGFAASVATLASALCEAVGDPYPFSASSIPLIEGIYASPGYAQLSPATTEALYEVAQKEGILLDPVYTGKALAGLLDLVEKGTFSRDEHVIFLHTGGLPGLWAYEDELLGSNHDSARP